MKCAQICVKIGRFSSPYWKLAPGCMCIVRYAQFRYSRPRPPLRKVRRWPNKWTLAGEDGACGGFPCYDLENLLNKYARVKLLIRVWRYDRRGTVVHSVSILGFRSVPHLSGRQCCANKNVVLRLTKMVKMKTVLFQCSLLQNKSFKKKW